MASRIFGQTKLERLFGVYNRKAELYLLVAAGVLVIHWSLVVWFVVTRLGTLEFLRLHYTAALGIDWIDDWWKIFVFPGVGLVALFVNALFAGQLSKTHRLLGALILGSGILLQIIFAIGGVMALLLNG
jgi:hypothetical protein